MSWFKIVAFNAFFVVAIEIIIQIVMKVII